MKKILLIHPWITDFAAYDFWIKPLGLLMIGTALKRAGHEVGLIDCVDRAALGAQDKRFATGKIPGRAVDSPPPLHGIPRSFRRFGMDDERFRAELTGFGRPDLVLVTCLMTYWYPGAHRVIEIVRDTHPGVPIGLGGNYVTLCPDHARQYSGADLFFPEKDSEHILARLQGILRSGPLPALLPFPDFSFYEQVRSIPLITSRGCPFACSYCAVSRLYPRFVQEDPDKVVAAITDYVKQHKVRDFAFFDDALLVRVGTHLHPILEGIIRTGLNLRFHLPNAIHAGAVTKKTAGLLFRSGFKTIRLGLESSSPSFQKKHSSAKVSNDAFRRAVRLLHSAGFTQEELGAYVLYGVPSQPDEAVIETLHMVHEAGIRSYLATYSPVPGTPDFETTARKYPAIRTEPLLHNKHLCCCRNPEGYRKVKEAANRLNQAVMKRALQNPR
ncbi:MAG: radical SAM protein [Deltaproteobacteria bacterium]|nr:radical SAM protein [Deltaproteobacteria bacterium]